MKPRAARHGAVLALSLLAGAQARRTLSSQRTELNKAEAVPAVSKVLALLYKLKAGVESDGVKEQQSYDEYQCWCEDTQAQKLQDITSAKDAVEQSQTLIIKTSGELASHETHVKQLNKDIVSHEDAMKDATQVRDQEAADYAAEKSEAEQCIGALEAAISVLSGAGTKKGVFLSNMQQAQLLSTVADVGRILQKPEVLRSTSAQDVETIQLFLRHPTAPTGLAALQAGANPFGDYAPQSTVITGILKGMRDNYKVKLKEDSTQEVANQKAFQDFMNTKQAEVATLQGTLQKQEGAKAKKEKLLADTRKSLATTKAQLKADKVFLQDTKATCEDVATSWSERSRLRSEELVGFNKAIGLLTSPQATDIFRNSTFTFLQESATPIHSRRLAGGPRAAYERLRDLASKRHSLSLAQVAVKAKTGGSFDKVIMMIDHMIAAIRKEEADDIAHRDRCQNSVGKNTNDLEDLQNTQVKISAEVSRMEDVEIKLKAKISTINDDVKKAQKQMQDMLNLRNQEQGNFKQALKDDTDAIAVLQQAIVFLTDFYKRNKIQLSLAQREQDAANAPQYTTSPDTSPKLEWSNDQYRKGQNKDIVSILAMLVEDLEKEIETSRQEEAAAQQDYEKSRKAASDMLHSLKESLVESDAELADLQASIADQRAKLAQTDQDLTQEQGLQSALAQDCQWVSTHFDSRRAKRKAELDGLDDAKSILGGANKGNFAALELSTMR